jgi:hypothetical protein
MSVMLVEQNIQENIEFFKYILEVSEKLNGLSFISEQRLEIARNYLNKLI